MNKKDCRKQIDSVLDFTESHDTPQEHITKVAKFLINNLLIENWPKGVTVALTPKYSLWWSGTEWDLLEKRKGKPTVNYEVSGVSESYDNGGNVLLVINASLCIDYCFIEKLSTPFYWKGKDATESTVMM